MLLSKFKAFLALGICAVFCTITHAADSTAWPTKPVRIIVPFAPGGVSDIVTRLVGQRLSEKWGQPVVVENITGAGGNIGMAAALRANADGYTIVMAPGGNLAINPNYLKEMPFSVDRDFTPVTILVDAQNVLVVSPNLSVTNLKELVELAKKRPGGITYASPGEGSTQHLAGALFQQKTSIQAVHVAYKGFAPALNDVLNGTVDMTFLGVFDARQYIAAGKLVPLAIAGATRSDFLPNVPAMGELGYPDFVANSWYSFVVRKGTPEAIIKKINTDVNDALKQDHNKILALGLLPSGKGMNDFASLLHGETQRWKNVMQQAAIKQQ